MKAQEQKYALERANNIFRTRKDRLDTAYKVQAKRLSHGERLKALRFGAFDVREDGEGEYSHYISTYLTFHGERDSGFADGYEAALAALQAAFDRLKDELMLGSASAALELLRAFMEAPEDAPAGAVA